MTKMSMSMMQNMGNIKMCRLHAYSYSFKGKSKIETLYYDNELSLSPTNVFRCEVIL